MSIELVVPLILVSRRQDWTESFFENQYSCFQASHLAIGTPKVPGSFLVRRHSTVSPKRKKKNDPHFQPIEMKWPVISCCGRQAGCPDERVNGWMGEWMT